MHESAITLRRLESAPLLGLKGPGAPTWLAAHGYALPRSVYEVTRAARDLLIVRNGSSEFVLQFAADDPAHGELYDELRTPISDVYLVPHEEATFLLEGARSREVLSQTCAINFAAAPAVQLIYTRVAGVSCAILPAFDGNPHNYRIWTDPSYANYLSETLAQIVAELQLKTD